ncbi:hypothetical protein KUL118_09970 [Tenacibaculum sp. KUL118]|nr:hypothetical protein KUL118_09970 [Tenacibaculum sp. KUL118]
MHNYKMEYEPLFQAGFKDIQETELRKVFVEPFDESERREYLVTRFEALLDRFKETGISSEVWVDGSFSTKKPEPGDIDMIFFVDGQEANNLPEEKKRILEELNDRNTSSIRYNCDVFIVPNHDLNMRSYWRGWFGFSRNEKPKGIIRISI